jgi:hypothetical protein
MNERIRELMDEAVRFRLDPDSNGYEAQVSPEDLEVFAELIVRECAQVIQAQNDIENDLDSWDHGFVAGLATAIDAIEQHFEVE